MSPAVSLVLTYSPRLGVMSRTSGALRPQTAQVKLACAAERWQRTLEITRTWQEITVPVGRRRGRDNLSLTTANPRPRHPRRRRHPRPSRRPRNGPLHPALNTITIENQRADRRIPRYTGCMIKAVPLCKCLPATREGISAASAYPRLRHRDSSSHEWRWQVHDSWRHRRSGLIPGFLLPNAFPAGPPGGARS